MSTYLYSPAVNPEADAHKADFLGELREENRLRLLLKRSHSIIECNFLLTNQAKSTVLSYSTLGQWLKTTGVLYQLRRPVSEDF